MTAQPLDRPARLLALCGSERPGGNTDQVLDHVVAAAAERGAEVEVIHLRDYRIEHCGSCGDCNVRLLPCAVQDDVAGIVARMTTADGVLYAAPVHGFGTSSLMQTFVERAGVGHLRFTRPLANKVAGVLVTGRRYNHEHVFSQLLLNVLLNRMIVVGSGFPALLQGGAPGAALRDREGIDAVDRTIVRMLDMVALLRRYRALTGDSFPCDDLNERVTRMGTRVPHPAAAVVGPAEPPPTRGAVR